MAAVVQNTAFENRGEALSRPSCICLLVVHMITPFMITHRLATCCGPQATPDAVKFLLSSSLVGDTTSDRYHNFADPSEQEKHYRALSQNRRFFCESVPRPTGEGGHPAPDSRKHSLLELEAAVKAGSASDLSCLHGISGTLSVLIP